MKPLYRTLLALFIAFSGLTTHAQKISSPLEMNDYLASITDSLYEKGQNWGTKFTAVHASKKFSELSPYRAKIESFIQRKRLEIIGMKDIGGSEKLRLAMLDFLAYEDKMIKEAFLPIEKLNPGSTDEQVKKAIDNLSTLADSEKDFLKKVNDTQAEYASRNGFTLDNEKEGKQ